MAHPTPDPPPLHPVLGPLAHARAVWTMGLGGLFLALAPFALAASGIGAAAICGGIGLLLLGLGAGTRWMLVRRRGLAAPPGTREQRSVMAGLAGLGALAFLAVGVHGVAAGSGEGIAAGVFGVILLGGLGVLIAVQPTTDPG